jgi:pimeloyl-ACP methyl ester carboxylesterase
MPPPVSSDEPDAGDPSDLMLDVAPDEPRWGHAVGQGSDGNELHYVRRGHGPPVLLLHGWPGFWYDWRRLIGPLSAEADTLAPDFRGFGDSPLPRGPAERTSGEGPLTEDLARLLDDLGVRGSVVVGFDVGAAVAQRLARRRPDLVAALVLLNPTHPGIGARRDEVALRGEFWYQQLHQFPWAADLIARDRGSIEVYLRHFYEHWSYRPGALRPFEFDRIVDVYARPGRFEASIAWYRARPRDRRAAAGADRLRLLVAQPAEVLWSDRDPVAPAAWADGIDEFLPNARVTRVPDAAHFIAWEDPRAVAQAVHTVLDRVG